jgi:hypothetical protein
MANLTHSYSRRRTRTPDGTADLAWGIWFLAWSLSIRLSDGTTVGWRWWATTYGLILAAWAITHFGVRAIRARLVYQRLGYVRLRSRSMALVALVAAVVGVTVAVVLGVYLARMGPHLLHPMLPGGLVIGLMLLVWAVVLHCPVYVGYAVLSVGIGVALQFLEPGLVSGAVWYFLLMGMAFLIGGAITLCLFVRRTPLQDLEGE